MNIILKKKIKQKGYVLILASRSKRRQKLLKELGIPFQVKIAKVKEHFQLKNIKKELLHNALLKAKYVSTPKKAIIIAGDTVIVYNNRVFGKPKNRSQAERFLATFSGKTHKVLTGLVIYNTVSKKTEKAVVTTKVKFKVLTQQSITTYLNCGEYKDKAGAYGIQAKGAKLVEKITGDYYNVVGLPIKKLKELLIKVSNKL
ncbi:nucleoside triphosphate pyrophosphatase [Candidatus Margulisiibacteriota bacterium]